MVANTTFVLFYYFRDFYVLPATGCCELSILETVLGKLLFKNNLLQLQVTC